MSETDVQLLFELLKNTMHHRGKEGPGGYSSATFSLKYVLFALRCLLTHTNNQHAVAEQIGRDINVLLMKALARHTTDSDSGSMDSESAEYACFSLYLLSNFGFEELPFLPKTYAPPENDASDGVDEGDLASKILVSYLNSSNTRPAGQHAAEQLLLRLKYLNFEDSSKNKVSHCLISFASCYDTHLFS
jgi:hypothetical protein